jgi:hypothetical protein
MTDTDDTVGEMSSEDAARWESARTLDDLGELTAQWLEGAIRSIPTVVPGYGPDEETILLIPVLAAANRAGYVTDFSQPGEDVNDWVQRAAVSGFASPAVLAALVAAAADTDLMITAGRAGENDWGTTAVVSVDNGRENTWAGGAQSLDAIRYGYEGDCHPAAVEALCGAWQVTLVDPVWGRNDLLWPVLKAFAASVRPT